VPSYFLTTKKAPQKEALLEGLVFYGDLWELSCELITTKNLAYFIRFKVEVKTHNVSMFDVIDVVMYVIAFTYRNETIVKCIVKRKNYYDQTKITLFEGSLWNLKSARHRSFPMT